MLLEPKVQECFADVAVVTGLHNSTYGSVVFSCNGLSLLQREVSLIMGDPQAFSHYSVCVCVFMWVGEYMCAGTYGDRDSQLAWNSHAGQPASPRNNLVSTSPVLELQICATMLLYVCPRY